MEEFTAEWEVGPSQRKEATGGMILEGMTCPLALLTLLFF